jgi:hypothetical protein
MEEEILGRWCPIKKKMKKLKIKRNGRPNSGTQLYDCRYW